MKIGTLTTLVLLLMLFGLAYLAWEFLARTMENADAAFAALVFVLLLVALFSATIKRRW